MKFLKGRIRIRCSSYLYLLLISSLLISCTVDESSIDYREAARGFWEVESVDPEISSGPAIVVRNWYAIDTTANIDTVTVTWDDGLACTKTVAEIEGDEIFIIVGSVEGVFKIHNDKSAAATFWWNESTCIKQLKKIRDDPQVFCD